MAPDLSSAAWAKIRYDYEYTDKPVEEICAENNISSGTLRDRMRRWNWTRRRAPIPAEGPPPAPAPQAAHAAPLLPMLPEIATAAPPIAPSLPSPADASENGGDELPFPASGQAITDGDEAAAPHPAAAPGGDGGGETSAPGEDNPAVIVPRLQNAVARVIPAIEATVAKLAAQPTHPREMERAARVLAALTRTLRELNGLLRQCPVPAAAPDPYDDIPEDMDEFREMLARRIELFVASRMGDAGEGCEPQNT